MTSQSIGRLPRPLQPAASQFEALVNRHGYNGGLLLFVDDGWLSALEYWWVTEALPDEFPPADAIGTPIAR